MKRDQNHELTDSFIKGGQVAKNSIVMFIQNIKMIVLPSLLIYSAIMICLFYSLTDEYERYLWVKKIHAETHLESMGDKTLLEFVYPDGMHSKVKASSILNSSKVISAHSRVSWLINILLISGVSLVIGTAFLVKKYLTYKGSKLNERKVVDGLRPLDTADELASLIKSENDRLGYNSSYSIAGVPFFDGSELFHISVTGAPGQGKTQLLIPLAEQVRENNHKAIIYDKARAFVKYFYNEETDIILNPLDLRARPWNIHAEAQTAIDYDSIFEAMIPEAKNVEPYWTLAARTIASKTALRFRQAKEYRMAPMLERLYNTSLDEIAAMLKGTEAGALIDCKNPKTGESLRSVMSTYIKGLGYCYDSPVVDPATGQQDLNRLFSITKWIQDDSQKGMVFITSQGDQEATLKPLITTFFNIAVTAGMSMESDLNRRIFIFLDELPALNRLPAIQRAAAELRQFGFVVVGGWQLYTMLEGVYGVTDAKSMAGIFNTIIQFNAGKEKTNVQKASEQFGTYTVRVPKDTLSIGVGPYRDGANFNFDDITYECVTEAQIRHLPKLQGYISMAGGAFPVAKFNKELYVPPEISVSMVPRPLEQLALGHYLVIGDGTIDLEQLVEDGTENGKTKAKPKSKETSLKIPPKVAGSVVSEKTDENEESSDTERPQKSLIEQAARQLGQRVDSNLLFESNRPPLKEDGLFDVEEAERQYEQQQNANVNNNQNSVEDDMELFR